jgi:copper ion binding protein
MTELALTVPDISCDHCVNAITGEVRQVDGVSAVQVDLDTKSVQVRGDAFDPDAVRAAVVEAGYEPQG